MTYFGKVFNTRELIGNEVVVVSKVPGVKFSGVMLEYFERNNAIVLKNYSIHRLKDGSWEVEGSGDILIIKGDAWAEILVPKFVKMERDRR